jgi:dTDP-4-amino-4,6-dideoxygalactose transaminase
MIRQKFFLIPRYNWDYGFKDFLQSTAASLGLTSRSDNKLIKVFGLGTILTNSGRASLFTILKALNLPKGSGVGVPLFCCPVVFDVILRAGLTPVFLDIDLDNYNLSVSDLKKKIDRMAALIVVHMFGHPADMDAIKSRSAGIPVIEDCAQALFTQYKGNYTGFLTEASFFSFRSGKYVSAGEGSVITCRNEALRKKMVEQVKNFERLHWTGELAHCAMTFAKSALYKRPWYGIAGYPIGRRLDSMLNLTAKSGFRLRRMAKSDLRIISNRIENFAVKIRKQQENAHYLLENIRLPNISLPFEKTGCLSNFYQFVIRLENQTERDRLASYLMTHGIDSAKYLDDVVDIAKSYYGYQADCPDAEKSSKTVLSVPHYYSLKKSDMLHIVTCLNNFAKTELS